MHHPLGQLDDLDPKFVCVDGTTYENVSAAFSVTGKLGTNGACAGFDTRNYSCDKNGKCSNLPDKPPSGIILPDATKIPKQLPRIPVDKVPRTLAPIFNPQPQKDEDRPMLKTLGWIAGVGLGLFLVYKYVGKK